MNFKRTFLSPVGQKLPVAKVDELSFGNCSSEDVCAVASPKGMDIKTISRLNSEFIKTTIGG